MKTTPLPTEHQLSALARTIIFPATRDEVLAAAEHGHHTRATLNFIRMFDPSDHFENASDFINRCEEVALCIGEESHAPQEQLRSP